MGGDSDELTEGAMWGLTPSLCLRMSAFHCMCQISRSNTSWDLFKKKKKYILGSRDLKNKKNYICQFVSDQMKWAASCATAYILIVQEALKQIHETKSDSAIT